MINKSKFLILFEDNESFEKLKRIMELRFSLDRIGVNRESINYEIRSILNELNSIQSEFSTGNEAVKDAYEICRLMLEGR